MFVVLEGCDGVGKTTQLDLLTKNTKYKTGRELGSFAEYLPKGVDLGIRDLIDRLYGKVSQATIAGLYRTNRGIVQDLYLKPLLAQGQTVVMDRWHLSSYIYTRAKQDNFMLAISLLEDPTVLIPDLTIVLHREDIDLAGREGSNGLFEDLGTSFTSTVGMLYWQFKSYFWASYNAEGDAKHPVVHLDITGQTPQQTHQSIVQTIEQRRAS